MQQPDSPLSLSEQNEQNKLTALDLADKIYRIMIDPDFLKEVKDPTVRHKMLMEKYPNFSQAYPVVLRYLSRDLKYSRNAFKQFLDKLETNPGKGMLGFIERQADYAKFLYLDIHKGKHPDKKKANAIWQFEYNNMTKWHKKMLDEEECAKNEFEEEKIENLEKKRAELLDFVNSFDEPEMRNEALDPFHEDATRMSYGLQLKNPKPKLDDINPDYLNHEELAMLYKKMLIYEDELLNALTAQNERIQELEELAIEKEYGIKVREDSPRASIPVQTPQPLKSSAPKIDASKNEWLQDTNAVKKRSKKQKTRRSQYRSKKKII
jgi:hypothetical protein